MQLRNTLITFVTLTALAATGALLTRPAATHFTPQPGKAIESDGRLTAAPAKAAPQRAERQRLGERNPLVPPFCETFDDFRAGMEHDDFSRYFQVIDANEDGRSWIMYNYDAEPYGKCAVHLYPYDVAQADDWLVPRAIRLEAGKYYCVSMDAALYAEGSTHYFEVKYGMFNDPQGLDTPVIPATKITDTRFKHVEGWICPLDDEIYYLGIHCISTDKTGWLFVDNIAMSAAHEPTVPGAATDIKITNDPNGTTATKIEFTTPAVTLDGTSLDDITYLEIRRDGSVLTTFANPAPGARLSYTDTPAAEGDYLYEFVPYNADGEGRIARAEHYVGIGAPAAPRITRFEEVENLQAVIEWEAPTADVNGAEINPDILTYNVYDITYEDLYPMAEGITARSATVDIPISENEQALMQLVVNAQFGEKVSDYAVSDLIFVGKSHKLPYHNSFAGLDLRNYVLAVTGDNDVVWRLLDDHSEPDSQDNDNGYISMIGTMPGQTSELSTGRIDMSGTVAPYMSFYTFAYAGDNNIIDIVAIDPDTEQRTILKSVTVSTLPRTGWNQIVVDLDNLAGKTARIGLVGHVVTHGYIPVDNLRIEDRPATDLAISYVEAPQSARVDSPFTIDVTILNKGLQPATDYTLTLTRDGKDVQTISGRPIGSKLSRAYSFTEKFSSVSPLMPVYSVRVDIDGDAYLPDNAAEPFSIAFLAPNHPTPTALQANETASGVQLSWLAPNLDKAPPADVTDSFESYDQYATSFGGWTTHDLDQGFIGGFPDFEMPIDRTQQAFWVMSNSGIHNFLIPHSGEKFLAQMYVLSEDGRSELDCDDWLISPELYGGPQIVEFWTSSLTDEYGYDLFEVLYSTSDANPEHFVTILPTTEASMDWTRYHVSLPDGARYFAIRCTSGGTYMFMLDDITFTPKGTPRNYTLLGYNIYRNDTKVNDTPVVATSFATTRELETDRYFVTAVYDLGESVASNEVRVGLDGIETVDTDPASAIRWYDLRGIELPQAPTLPGIYLMRQGATVTKVRR